ncbi:MAG: amino acid permease [Desulfobacter sp.]|nr:MAG: amino acid permease [Desulfobacter sp.]
MENETTEKLGTFSGVFTPSILTILGIILFRRHGYVVGSSGLGPALMIMAVANLISILTSFSLAAIATNMKVKGGGDYYLISRTLGKEFGGAIGLVLFLAQSVSIGFYCIGFGEAVEGLLQASGTQISSQAIGFAAVLFLFVLAWFGADLATKFQYVVMGFLVLALASFYAGGIQNWDTGLLIENWSVSEPKMGFWPLFAIFFPAVTGFTQGVSMSGDLEDPGKSLPSGTFAAVGLSIAVYFSAAIIFSASNTMDSLVTDYDAMKKTAAAGFLIDAGVIAATLSSAMASFLGAPRILQSLSADKIFKSLTPFAKGYGPANNPRKGVLLSLALAAGVISLGQLDLIAGIVSMFFLISYGLLNYATYFEASTQSPSFRPRFKWYHRYVSMAGFLACLGVMLAIDIRTGIASTAVLFAIYQYLSRVEGPARWADSQRSYHLQRVRYNLLNAWGDMAHPREWRPYIIILSYNPLHLPELLRFSDLLEGGSGISTAVKLVRGKGLLAMKQRQAALDQLKEAIKAEKSSAFPLAVSAMGIDTAVTTLFQTYGLGPIKANTAIFNWKDFQGAYAGEKEKQRLNKYLKSAVQARCNILLPNMNQTAGSGSPPEDTIRRIDVWWNGDDSSRLMLLLAYLVTRDKRAASAEINLLAVNYDRENKDVKRELAEILDDYRIDASPSVVLGLNPGTILDKSKDADIVFLPFILKNGAPAILGKFEPEPLIQGLRNTAMTMAAIPIDLDAAPEEGEAGELAAIHDELEHAITRVSAAEKQVEKTIDMAKERLASISEREGGLESKMAKKLVEKINGQIADARKKALKEKVKLDELAKRAKNP